MQLLVSAILGIAATQRLNNMGPTIEPCGTLYYLAVRKNKPFEPTTCKKCC